LFHHPASKDFHPGVFVEDLKLEGRMGEGEVGVYPTVLDV